MIAVFIELVARGALIALSVGTLLAVLWVAAACGALWVGAVLRHPPAGDPHRPARRGRAESLAAARPGV